MTLTRNCERQQGLSLLTKAVIHLRLCYIRKYMRHSNTVMKFAPWENTGWMKDTPCLYTLWTLHWGHLPVCTHSLILQTVSQHLVSFLLNVRIGKTCDLGNFEHDMIADMRCVSFSSRKIFKYRDSTWPILAQ